MSDSHWVGVTFCLEIEAKAGVRGLGLIMPGLGHHRLLVLYVTRDAKGYFTVLGRCNFTIPANSIYYNVVK